VDGLRGPPAELTGANPVSFDVRGRGLRVGSGLAGIWPSYAGQLDFTGGIVEVRILCHAARADGDAHAQARVALIEQ
jgi:hypothetical protein